jgi:hypothetical protein
MLMPWPELETKQDIIDLYTDHDRLQEALERFADPDNWDDGDERTDWAVIVWDNSDNPIDIAREALTQGGQDET